MNTLQENTMEFILDKIDELKKDKQTREEAKGNHPEFAQIHLIQIKLIDKQIELLRQMIIKDTI